MDECFDCNSSRKLVSGPNPRFGAVLHAATASYLIIEAGVILTELVGAIRHPHRPDRRREAVDEHAYLIRYGVMGHIGRFATLPGCETSLERDQLVVIQTHRGIELGEVLVPVGGMSALRENGRAESAARSSVDNSSPSPPTDRPHLLRPAGPEDLIRGQQAEELRPGRFTLCQRILQDGNWPLEVIDVEPLLDGNAIVLHYLGPHQLDVRPLRAWFRMACDLEVVLEPFGIDPESALPDWITQTDDEDEDQDEEVESTCGNCDCGAGGCGTKAESSPSDAPTSVPASSGCATAAHAGCASCGISRLRSKRSRVADGSVINKR
jgi:hypothetical protein